MITVAVIKKLLFDNDESVYDENLIMPYSIFVNFNELTENFRKNSPIIHMPLWTMVIGHACSVCDIL